jgi:tetratricopeptide (TPR) repeat protein
LAKVAVQCSADTFVVNQSLVIRINICGENRHLRQAQNRYMPLYMKTLITLLFFFILTQSVFSQPGLYKNGFEEWEKESLSNKRLLPRYGHLPKTEQETISDSSFIKQIMSQPQFKTRRDASNHLIKLGFQYYYRDDLKTAMSRFNQAYLLDSTNSDDYWGYGAVYMRFGMLGLAADQYEAGLKIDSTNTHLWTDYATMRLAQYYRLDYEEGLDTAIIYLNKSYSIDPKDVNTVYKLSICYWNKKKCNEAWRFYDECLALGGQPITEEFKKDMQKRCKR